MYRQIFHVYSIQFDSRRSLRKLSTDYPINHGWSRRRYALDHYGRSRTKWALDFREGSSKNWDQPSCRNHRRTGSEHSVFSIRKSATGKARKNHCLGRGNEDYGDLRPRTQEEEQQGQKEAQQGQEEEVAWLPLRRSNRRKVTRQQTKRGRDKCDSPNIVLFLLKT